MDISYLFPIFENDDAKKFFEKFLGSKFFCEQKNVQILTYVIKNDEKNLTALLELSKQNKIFKVIVEENKFTYNDIFKKAMTLIKGEILLLGDAKINNLSFIFSKCVEKYLNGANVVLVKKKYSGFKKFLMNISQSFYNFFIKIFTGKKDRLNIISLGLYDKNVLDVFQTLPDKCCFLKNTKDLFGFSSKTIYIDSNVETYKLNFAKKTFSLLSAIISLSLFIILLITAILLNIFIQDFPVEINIFAIFGFLILFLMTSLLFPKHFYDVRNDVENSIKKIK